jgi:hypothetical protein
MDDSIAAKEKLVAQLFSEAIHWQSRSQKQDINSQNHWKKK